MPDDQDSTPVKPCYLNILENEQPLNSAIQKDSLTTIDSSKQPNPLPLPLTEIETLVPAVKEVKSAQETPESSLAGSPDTESPVLVNDYVRIIYISFLCVFLHFQLNIYSLYTELSFVFRLSNSQDGFRIQTDFKLEQKGDSKLR